MHKMQVDVENGRPTGRLRHQVSVPNLLEQCSPGRHEFRESRCTDGRCQFFTQRQAEQARERPGEL